MNALQGNLGPGVLAHLLQYLALQGAIGRLNVWSNGGSPGQVYLARGRVLHIELEGLPARVALGRMLTWEDGRFAFQVGVVAPVTSVDMQVQALLLSLAIEREGRGAVTEVSGPNGAYQATQLVDPRVVPGLVWAAVVVAGPIGEIFVDEAFESIGHHPRLLPEEQLGSLLLEVAGRFKSAQGREDFLTRAEAVLAHHGYGRVEG